MTRKKKTITQKPTEPIKKELAYTGEALLNSGIFDENFWLATVVLDKSKKYVPDEAIALVQAHADRKVV